MIPVIRGVAQALLTLVEVAAHEDHVLEVRPQPHPAGAVLDFDRLVQADIHGSLQKQQRPFEPGGCAIGARPVDLHVKGLRALGAQLREEAGFVHARGPLRGEEMFLSGSFGSTVLGTDNVMMAATLAEGTTTITSAACEPEVVDLALLLTGEALEHADELYEAVLALPWDEHMRADGTLRRGDVILAGEGRHREAEALVCRARETFAGAAVEPKAAMCEMLLTELLLAADFANPAGTG